LAIDGLEELHANWKWVKFGEIVEINPNIDYSNMKPDLSVTFYDCS
jgi:hypothetical protein